MYVYMNMLLFSIPHSAVLRYGSQISLINQDLRCWLHSHDHLYPLKYPDERGSSYQQQVTCYEFEDINNLWEIRRPDDKDDETDSSPIRNKDIVQLVHMNSSKLLNRSVLHTITIYRN